MYKTYRAFKGPAKAFNAAFGSGDKLIDAGTMDILPSGPACSV